MLYCLASLGLNPPVWIWAALVLLAVILLSLRYGPWDKG